MVRKSNVAVRTTKTLRLVVRQLANRWVGILHVCLERGCLYDEENAWPMRKEIAA
jgi:hypothetical protein